MRIPAILLVAKSGAPFGLAKECLQGRGLQFLESWDIFTAMNEICDFTQESRPDVIVVNVDSISESLQTLTLLLTQGSLGVMEYPVFTLADDLPSKAPVAPAGIRYTSSRIKPKVKRASASKARL